MTSMLSLDIAAPARLRVPGMTRADDPVWRGARDHLDDELVVAFDPQSA